ncbi:protein transport protein SEC23 [Nymphaea colorata]|nr:protein transport protein SEC23 [Nymphaea colorata]
MDFVELEAVEGLRWSWNSWPKTKGEAASLVIPLSIMHTPLMEIADLPVLSYEPLICKGCSAVLNPYARVDYQTRLWVCPFCYLKNPFPGSYAGISENNLPAELFPTYSTVEYRLNRARPNWRSGHFPSPSSSLSSSLYAGGEAGSRGAGPTFVFVLDTAMAEDEFQVLKKEILHVVAQLPDSCLVGLVTFSSMVHVHDVSDADCSRAVVFHGERDLSPHQIQQFLGTPHLQHRKFSNKASSQTFNFLLPISECEFSFTAAVEELTPAPPPAPGYRSGRSTGVAISVATGLIEASSPSAGSRIMVFLSGPTTLGPGMVVGANLGQSIRTHRDLLKDRAPHYKKSCDFYRRLAQRLCDASIVLDAFACSLDQVGTAELRSAVESSGGWMVLAEAFASDQFKKCLQHIFQQDDHGHLKMNFDATIDIVATKEVKICGALGPCVSLLKKNSSVSDMEVGFGGSSSWKLGTLTSKTCLAFFFEVEGEQKSQAGPVFFIQFITRYRHGDGIIRLRVTTAARRWAESSRSPEIAGSFDQEAAAAVMARLAVDKIERGDHTDEVIRWLDRMLVRFAAKYGDYVKEDPTSFRLSSNFSLYPQFMYYFRRSQFIDVFNSSPDETAFFRLMLNREGVVGSLIMIQPTLFRYSFDGPPVPVLLDVSSISSDSILLFDSFFYVVIHYGSQIAQWRKLGYHKDPNHENLKKLLEAPVQDAEALLNDRIPVPKLINCDQHGSQARFLLAKLNPSVTHDTLHASNTSEVILTDDVSLQVFIDHLQKLAVGF